MSKSKQAKDPQELAPEARAEFFRQEANRQGVRGRLFRQEADDLAKKLARAEATIEALADALVAEKAKSEIPF